MRRCSGIRAWALLGLSSTACIVGCGPSGPDDVAPDGSVADVGVYDAGDETPMDAGRDSGRHDAGPRVPIEGPPYVVSVSPLPGSSGLDRQPAFTIELSEPVDGCRVVISDVDAGDYWTSLSSTSDPGLLVEHSDDRAFWTFTPETQALFASRLSLSIESCRDDDGIVMENSEDFEPYFVKMDADIRTALVCRAEWLGYDAEREIRFVGTRSQVSRAPNGDRIMGVAMRALRQGTSTASFDEAVGPEMIGTYNVCGGCLEIDGAWYMPWEIASEASPDGAHQLGQRILAFDDSLVFEGDCLGLETEAGALFCSVSSTSNGLDVDGGVYRCEPYHR